MKLNLQGTLFKIKMMYCEKRPSGNMWDLVIDVEFDDILYIENYNRNTLVCTEEGEYLITATFGVVKKILEKDERFQYSHCSYLVNVQKVCSIRNTMIKVASRHKKYEIPLAKRRQKEFCDAYEKYGKSDAK